MKRSRKNKRKNLVISATSSQILFALLLGILLLLASREYFFKPLAKNSIIPAQNNEVYVSLAHTPYPTYEIPVTQAVDYIFSTSVYKFKILVPAGWHPSTTEKKMDENKYPGSSLVMWSSIDPQTDNYQMKVDVLINTEGKHTLFDAKKSWEDPKSFNQEDGTYNGLLGRYRIHDISFKGKPAFEIIYDNKHSRDIIVIGDSGYLYNLAYYDFDGTFSSQDNATIQKIFESFEIY